MSRPKMVFIFLLKYSENSASCLIYTEPLWHFSVLVGIIYVQCKCCFFTNIEVLDYIFCYLQQEFLLDYLMITTFIAAVSYVQLFLSYDFQLIDYKAYFYLHCY